MNNLTQCELICCDTLFHFKGHLLLLYKKGKWCVILFIQFQLDEM